MTRKELIAAFLTQHGYGAAKAVPLAQDASFRRYWRLTGGARPAVLMDAPPPEDVRPFLRIAAHLSELGLSVPDIIAVDEAAGFVLEEDLGDRLFPTIGPDVPAETLFDAAVDVLIAMQRAAPPAGLPIWDAHAMIAATLDPLFDWWWPAAFGGDAPGAARQDITEALAALLAPLVEAPRVFVHRDFFAGNLIWLPERDGLRRVGVLDFQSAAVGHPAYDLVSLVQDARRAIPPALAERAVARFRAAWPELDPASLVACAAQRHLRVATQWVRLARRDGRPEYLAYGPRTWDLLAVTLRDPAAAPLAAALDRWVPLAMRGNPAKPSEGSRGRLSPGGGSRGAKPSSSLQRLPHTAMILAAGLGTRMRPLTEATAKPLLPLGGKALLDHALGRLQSVGVERAVVNAFWQADRVAAHLAMRAGQAPETVLRREETLLDTGGGVRAALDVLGDDPFYVINGDAFWLDGPRPALARLAERFAEGDVDAVLLVHRTCQVHADVGAGDFAVDGLGRVRRRREREVVPYIYAGVQIVAPRLLADMPEGAFSMNRVWDRAIATDRLRAVVHDGLWFHLSSPADLSDAESILAARLTGDTR